MNELPVGSSVQLTPDQIAQIQPPQIAVGQSIRLDPDQAKALRQQTGQLDPLQDFSAEQLVELQKQNPEFNLINQYSARTDLQQQPGMNQKIADAHNLLRRSPISPEQFGITPGAGVIANTGGVLAKAGGAVWDIAKGFGKQAWNYAQAASAPVTAMVTAPFTDEETTRQIFNQGQREIAENVAGTELGMSGLAKTVESAAGVIARKTGLAKSLDQYTPEEKVADLFDALKLHKQQQEIAQGKGPILTTLGSEVVNELQKNGTPVRPEEVAELAAGDPFSWYLMGKAFHGVGSVVPEAASQAAARVTEGAGQLAAKLAGKTVETAADITKLGSDAVKFVAPVTSAIVGAVKGAELHGPAGLVTGAGLGYKAGKYIAEGAKSVGESAAKVGKVGEEIAGNVPVTSPVAQLGRDIATSAPGAAVELGKGVAFDLGLAAVTSEESPEDRSGLGIGTAFGILGATARTGGRVLSGQIIAPRAYGITRTVPGSLQFPALESMHNEAITKVTPGVSARLNAIRLFLRGIDPNADVFLAPDSGKLGAALQESGMSPEQAKTFAAQQGFFSADLPDKNGKPRRVIVVKDPDTAPHEAFHAIQDVLGEEANQGIDKIVKDAYSDQWDPQGERYAARLVGAEALKTSTWREAILDASGWGRAEAADKISREIANRIAAATGAQPDPAAVRDLANAEWARLLAEAKQKNPNVPAGELQIRIWRDVLNPDEAKTVGDRYLARELAAENFDAVFKHTGPTLEQNPALLSKLSRIVGNLVSSLGGNPLAGRVSEGSAIPLNPEVGRAVVEAAGKTRNEAGPVAVEGKAPKFGVPATPEAQTAAAAEAKDLADKASDQAPAPKEPNLPTPQSPREVLGTIAEAIAKRGGVKINYLSAPEEPAAATTSNRPARRAMIETFRSMPAAARRLWEKTFFPERVLKLKGDRYQVLGWAPEVFAANAHKLANSLADIEAKTPNAFVSPYEIDPKTRTFTTQGWRNLYADAQTFVKNQVAGRTGAGEKLVVPAALGERGFHAPPVTGGAEPLSQGKADIINMLFNFRLPDTARVTAGKIPLNIAGQEISAATKPGRVTVPVEPKPKFEGASAKQLGIEGRSILEVNPARNALERAAKAAGVGMPSMLEAIQRLNLEHISEVQHAPEASPEFRGNTLTLTAGFQPGEDEQSNTRSFEKKAPGLIGTYANGFNDVRNVRDLSAITHESLGLPEHDPESDQFNWRYRPDNKTVYWWGETPEPVKDSVLNWLDRMGYEVERTRRIVAGENTPSYTEAHGQFSPVQAMDSLKTMSDDDFLKLKEYKGKLGGGPSGWAFDLGASAQTPEDLQAFKHANEVFRDMGREAMKAGQMDDASKLFTKAQLAREAYEVATGQKIDGTGDAGNTVIKLKNPDFTPPFLGEKKLALPAENGENEGVNKIENIAKKYAKSAGLNYEPPKSAAPVKPELMKRIADFYQGAKHSPDSPEVEQSYAALAKEVTDQYKAIEAAGYKIEPWTEGGEPYANSAAMVKDINENKHLFFKPTESDITGGNLMLAPSGIPGLSVNDVFRAVHDFFGHAKSGHQFGPTGEYNAWLEHAAMFSDAAQPALAAETLAQNAWVNYGSHLRNEMGEVPKKGEPGFKPLSGRPFAEQKNTSVAQDLISEARGQFKPESKKSVKVKETDWKLKPASSGFSKAWILPDGRPVQLGGQWHHDWLNEAADVRKQFKVPETETTENNRIEALKRGFTRVNYDAKDGRLTVEAREQDWPDARAAVKKFIESNLPQIDKVQMYLFNKNVDVINDSGSANLFDKPKAERMAAVPFIGAPAEDQINELSPQATKGALSEQVAPGAAPVRGGAIKKGQFSPLEESADGKTLDYRFGDDSTRLVIHPSGLFWEVKPKEEHADVIARLSKRFPSEAPNFVRAIVDYRPDYGNELSRLVVDDWDSKLTPKQISGLKSAATEMGLDKLHVESERKSAQFQPRKLDEPERGPVWFSQLAKTIDEKVPASATVQQLEAILRNPQNGIKADELKWSGLDDFLKRQGDNQSAKITKVGVQKWITANQVQLKEIRLGKGNLPNLIARERSDEEGVWDIYDKETEELIDGGYANERSANREIARLAEGPGTYWREPGTKFEQYQLPGGENYREILFQLPQKPVDIGPGPEKLTSLPSGFEYIHDSNPTHAGRMWGIVPEDQAHARTFTGTWWPSKERALEDLLESLNLEAESRHRRAIAEANAPSFKSGHWDEPNVVAHARVNDRVDSEDRPGLFLEEIQSDWHQKGRKLGYKSESANERAITAFKSEREKLLAEGYTEENGFWQDPNGKTVAMTTLDQAKSDVPRLNALVEAYKEYQNTRKSGPAVPDAPFKNSWHEMVFRRMVREAAEQGKKWIGWTTGEQQAERYDLSKQLGRVRIGPSGREGDFYDIQGYDHDGTRVVNQTDVPESDLADYVGKELATKAISDGAAEKTQFYSGLDLKVGGEGMRGFYDKIMVDYAKKFGKKFGAKVEDRDIAGPGKPLLQPGDRIIQETPNGTIVTDAEGNSAYRRGYRSRAYDLHSPDGEQWQWVDDDGEPVGPIFSSEQRAINWQKSGEGKVVHSMEITPAMRESVLKQGVAQFQPGDVSSRFAATAPTAPRPVTNKKAEDLVSPRPLVTP